MSQVLVWHGDAIEQLRRIPDNSVHAVITDPPYGLSNLQPSAIAHAIARWNDGERDLVPVGKGFMGRDWDSFVPPPAVWDEAYRVLKPGGHVAVFGGSRTFDLVALSVRMAGFEMRDTIAAWLYGSGFPKSMNVAKAIESGSGRPEDIRRMSMGDDYSPCGRGRINYDHGAGSAMKGSPRAWSPATDAAREWQGWGSALKPAWEPIILARKPLAGTVAANVLAHRAGAINVDACRVATPDGQPAWSYPNGAGGHAFKFSVDAPNKHGAKTGPDGRWPTNVVLAHHPDCGPDDAPGPCVPGCQVAALDEQSGWQKDGVAVRHRGVQAGPMGWGKLPEGTPDAGYGGGGGASRFFPTFRYQAKAPKRERPMVDGKGHPTVKPLGLMQWLCRLLVAPGGLVVDPFCGSGATGEAARAEGFSSILIDADEFAIALTKERLYG